MYAAIVAVQFTLVNWTHPVGAYRFGISNMYAAVVAVQFTLVNWTHPVGAYRFGVSNMYAAVVTVQFTIVNWTHYPRVCKIPHQSDCNDGGNMMNLRFYTFIATINVLDGRIIYFLHHLSIYS